MRTHQIVMALAMLAIFSLATISCGNSDGPSSGSLIGTWKMDLDLDDIFGANRAGYTRFHKDGTGLTVSVTTKYDPSTGEKTEPEVDVDKFTYTVDGDKLTTIEGDGEIITGKYSVSGNTLTISNTTGLIVSFTFTKVDDSELDQYLK